MNDPQTENPPAPVEKDGKGGFRLTRVLLIVSPVALVLGAGVLFFGTFDGATWLKELTYPPLVSGEGQVIYAGQPLALGEIRTRHTNANLPGAIGFLDDQGRFKIQTEIKGDRIDGAYVGEHKVRVTKYGPAQGPFAPLIIPEKYASFATTPLTLVISKSAADNTYTITLEDDEGGAPRPSDRPGGSPAGANRPPTEDDSAGPSPGEITNMLFDQYDANSDGQLVADELTSLNEEQRAAILRADRAGDGVGRQELFFAAGRLRQLFPTVTPNSESGQDPPTQTKASDDPAENPAEQPKPSDEPEPAGQPADKPASDPEVDPADNALSSP